MRTHLNPRLVSVLKSTSRAASVFVIVIGCLVLVGWVLDITLLKSILPGLGTMKVNTAIAFVLGGVALGVLSEERVASRKRWVVYGCAGIVAVLGLLTLCEYLFGWDLGIDQLLFRETLRGLGALAPGRMSPATALNLFLLGAALCWLDSPRGHRFAHACTLVALLVSLLAIIGYAYGVGTFYQIGPYTAIALPTALAIVILCAGILLARPDRGLVALLASDTVGGLLTRRLLPAAILIPFILGWLRVSGQNAGYYDTQFGSSLFALSNMVLFTGLIWWNAGVLNQADMHRRKAEEELRQLNAELERRVSERTAQLEATNKELEAFCYSVSHDLRAPLRSIDGFSQALLEDYAGTLDAQADEYLQRIRAATQRMAQLIDDLLNLSRLTRSEMRCEEVDLSSMARTVAAELQKTDPLRSVEFVIAEGAKDKGDPRLLRAVLENLLSNAWKFTGKCTQAHIEFGVLNASQQPTYFVKDNGVGFDMAYADKLFGVFQRLHATTEFPGTGVGLAIVQRIVHRHGGRVWAEGAIGQGATFYFTLSPE